MARSDAVAAIAATIEQKIRTCCDRVDPICGMKMRLNANAPRIEPSVLIAYTRPDNRAGSSFDRATEASARGKLAPHIRVAGRMAHTVRAKSSSKLNQGFMESHGSTGQKGNECDTV